MVIFSLLHFTNTALFHGDWSQQTILALSLVGDKLLENVS